MTVGGVFLTVLMPAYNEEAGLTHAVNRLSARLDELPITTEILIVNDCSRDQTGALAETLAAHHSRVRVIHHSNNRGIGGGFVTGVANAHGQWLILIPADLALDLADLSKYLEAAEGADVVVGIRSDRRDYSWFRLLVSWVNIRLTQLLFGMRERQFNYICMYRLDLLKRIEIKYWQSAFFHAEVLIKIKRLGGRLVEREIRYTPRLSGKATGARWSTILRSVQDLIHFRLRSD